MSELKFFLVRWVLIQNFNIVDLVKYLEKNQKPQIQIIKVTLKVTSCKTMKKKEVKTQDSMDKTNFFFSTLPFSPWVVLVTWLHVGAPQKIQEK
jgi:hypothetical protein